MFIGWQFGRKILSGLAVLAFIVVTMEGLARGVRSFYGSEVHAKFSVNDSQDGEFYAVNELGAMGRLRTSQDRVNIAVLGGSATFNNGFERSWPVLFTKALPHGHLDNFSVTGPRLLKQLTVLKQIEAQGLHYDILFFEPPYMPLDPRLETPWLENPWVQRPIKAGPLALAFPRLFAAQAGHFFAMDPWLVRIGWIAHAQPFSEQENVEQYLAQHGRIPYVDVPELFGQDEEKIYEQRVRQILTEAKKVANRVVVVAPVIHFHAAADGSDQENFFKLLPAPKREGFVSLASLASAIWEKNRILKRLAGQYGLNYYDGNQAFGARADHRELFFDQVHLLPEAQKIIANQLLHMLGFELKVEVQKGIHLRAGEHDSEPEA